MLEQKMYTVPGSARVPLPGAKAMHRTNPHLQVEVLVKVRRQADAPEPSGVPGDYMTREEVGDAYGSSTADIDLVATVLQQQGLHLESADAATRSVEFSGSVAQMEKAFGTTLFDYDHPDGGYRGRVGELRVPEALKAVVVGVFGLDDRRVAYRRRRRPAHAAGMARALSAIPTAWYLPQELATRYSFPDGDGTGQSVGVLEFGGGYFASDMQAFCKAAGVDLPNVVPMSVDGTPTGAKDGAEGEVMLDVEILAGVCPKATIVAYFAHFSERGWIKALNTVMRDTTHRPSVVSVSWGNPEEGGAWTKQAVTQVNETLKDASLAGITVCVAAGDDGSSDAAPDGLAHADFPASSPYVLAVGGTTIPSKAAPLPDIVWFEGNGMRQQNVFNSGSTGGAVSTMFPRPQWQQAITIKSINPHAINGRVIPDVAANADWGASPYLLVVNGQAEPNGGTSAATPLVASLLVRLNQARGAAGRLGFLTPILYGKGSGGTIGQSACDDVISGDNNTAHVGGYAAGPGFDAVSGWGTLNGKKLLAELAAAWPAQAAAAKEPVPAEQPGAGAA